MPSLQDVIGKLTDVYQKRPDSSVGKLLDIITLQLQALDDTLKRTAEWRDIDKAEGTTLDMIGETVIQPRGAAPDEVFRLLIKSKIARNLSTTDINTIIQVLATALDANYEEITITEMWADPVSPEPAAISMIQVPITRLLEIGLDPDQLARIVQRTVAGGVRVGVIELAGTFSFSDGLDYQEDPDAGFGDLAGTTGGYLGAAFVPASDTDLPI